MLILDPRLLAGKATSRHRVIISRVPQNLPIQQRVNIWLKAVQDFLTRRPSGKLVELLEAEKVVSWEIRELQ